MSLSIYFSIPFLNKNVSCGNIILHKQKLSIMKQRSNGRCAVCCKEDGHFYLN